MDKESLIIYKRILIYVKPYWRRLLLAMIFMLGVAGTTSALAFLVKPALDSIFFEKNRDMLNLMPLAILVAYALKGICNFSQEYHMNYVGQKVIMDIRQALYDHIQRLSLYHFISIPMGQLISRITGDVGILQASVSRAITSIIKDLFTALGLLCVVFYRDFKLALIAFFILPFLFIPIFQFGLKTKHYSYKVNVIVGNMLSFLKEYFSGIRIVKVFNLEEKGKKIFADENLRFFKNYMKQIKVRAISGPIIELMSAFAIAGVIWYGGKEVIAGKATPGNFFSFITALILLYEPIKRLNGSYSTIQEGIGAAKRVFEIMDISSEELIESKATKELKEFKDSIEFRNVSFRYDKDYVLKNFNLKVKKGEKIGIVGVSGGGKSTLVNLLPRFYEIEEGQILIDGVDIKEYSLKSIRSMIAMVTQEVILFNATVKENILYGKENADFEEVIRSAQNAHAHDFIMSFPEQYETNVGEMGEFLSGGERQRIAIARAFIKDAPIIILDEATSALDTQSEREVQKALDELMSGKTCFIIAHRLSTLVNMDRIIVLKDGEIYEDGSHSELMEKKGEYYRLYTMQQGR
ncbi:MAG: ABC transporter ATP-binding protein/permease [Proteobacteria bacterium]|nr:ABC transporter ATP-binding protein/permease [Pseudomonadota bacterium]